MLKDVTINEMKNFCPLSSIQGLDILQHVDVGRSQRMRPVFPKKETNRGVNWCAVCVFVCECVRVEQEGEIAECGHNIKLLRQIRLYSHSKN